MSEIEFSAWETPFKDGNITILDVRFQTGKLNQEHTDLGIGYTMPAKYGLDAAVLTVRLFHKDVEAIFSLLFRDVGAFRLLDEHGLDELWQESVKQGNRPTQSTLKVRNHLWAKESPLAFFSFAKDNWSFVIGTDWECVEIVCKEPPNIQLEETVCGYPLR
ncbi:MAG: hypothetical protein O3B08_19555 [Proteobacteria bacterium]|nr:hypothetical protein [Pseudomonadota bacterium]